MKKLFLLTTNLIFISSMFFVACKKDSDTEQCGSPFTIDLGADTEINEGESLTLDATTDGATYLWSTGETTASIDVDTTGTYWVSVSTCYGSESDTINITLNYITIQMSTNYGEINIWLYHQTPLHRQNFIDLTADGFYDGLIFHRVIQDFVIQGGDPEGTGFGGPGYTVPAEIKAGLSHLYGAVGAARLGNNVNPDKESNGSQFYIVSDQNGESGLDGEYTVFGQVMSGLDIVYAISEVAVDNNDRPIEDVIMNTVSNKYYTATEIESLFGFEIPQ